MGKQRPAQIARSFRIWDSEDLPAARPAAFPSFPEEDAKGSGPGQQGRCHPPILSINYQSAGTFSPPVEKLLVAGESAVCKFTRRSAQESGRTLEARGIERGVARLPVYGTRGVGGLGALAPMIPLRERHPPVGTISRAS